MLRVVHKGGRREALAINLQAVQRIRGYLERADMATRSTRRCSAPCVAMARPSIPPVAWTRTLLIASSENTRRRSASGVATQRIRCVRRSSRPRWKTARRWRTCRRRSASRSINDQALRPAWLQSRARGQFVRDLLTWPMSGSANKVSLNEDPAQR